MMNNIIIKTVYLLLLLITLPLHSEIRYVSKTGSAHPPYTSWATASDSIQKAINISSFGDTIYVANGVYKEQIVMIPGLSLIGSGMDSCVIDTRELVTPTDFYAVTLSDSVLVKGFRIIVSNIPSNYDLKGIGFMGTFQRRKHAVVEFNLIEQVRSAFYFSSGADSFIIRKNIIKETREGFNLSGIISASNYFIEENYISGVNGIRVTPGGQAYIKNNVISVKNGDGISKVSDYSIFVENNIVIRSDTTIPNLGTNIGYGISGNNSIIKNNIAIGNFYEGGIRLFTSIYSNNIAINGKDGFNYIDGSNPILKYNNSWNNYRNNYRNITPDSTNMSVDPMFVDTSGWDFRLQKHSPMIDAGDPEILDVDGTRSDIGVYGGPFGMSYPYEDLAPSKPRGTELIQAKNKTFLRWRKNTESDITGYKIYNDTIPEFPISQQTYFASITDTLLEITEMINSGIPRAYLKVTALDSLGNESVGGEEVLWGEPLTVKTDGIIPQAYKLYQNYPNPFNPTTTIGYTLKNRGYVKLMVYDIKGEMIKVLSNEWKERGYHEEEFNYSGQKLTSLASGIYLYKLEIIDENMIPVFTDIKKMILIK